jgi:hypothetical protein
LLLWSLALEVYTIGLILLPINNKSQTLQAFNELDNLFVFVCKLNTVIQNGTQTDTELTEVFSIQFQEQLVFKVNVRNVRTPWSEYLSGGTKQALTRS